MFFKLMRDNNSLNEKIIKIVFELIPENKMLKPYEHPYSYIFRGVLFDLYRELDPNLVHRLHEYEEIRPYSINCIIYNKIPKIDFILTSFNKILSQNVLDYFNSHCGETLNIGDKQYLLSNIKIEIINLRNLIKKARPVTSFSIKLVTPTSFNTILGNFPVRFPLPSILFGNLINLWNNFFELKGEINKDSFIDWVNAHLYVSFYDLRTIKRKIEESNAIYGAKGSVSYKITRINKFFYRKLIENKKKEQINNNYERDYNEKCLWIDILCRFGEYTNVGVNRTAGMGVIKYFPKTYLKMN